VTAVVDNRAVRARDCCGELLALLNGDESVAAAVDDGRWASDRWQQRRESDRVIIAASWAQNVSGPTLCAMEVQTA
jgi:hypothetical protein